MSIHPWLSRGSFLLLALFVQAVQAGSAELFLQWKESADLDLTVGARQTLMLEDTASIEVGIPQTLKNRLEIINTGAYIAFNAKQKFTHQEVILKHPDRGLMSLNVSADSETTPRNYVILFNDDKPKQFDTVCTASNYVDITRWVLQKIYSPQRLLKYNSCLHEEDIPVVAELELFKCDRTSLCGGGVRSDILYAWYTQGDLWVYALLIKNEKSERTILDPRDVIYSPALRSITFAHAWLGSAGSHEDQTFAILISDKKQPFTSREIH